MTTETQNGQEILHPNSYILFNTYYGQGIVNRYFAYFIHISYNSHLAPIVTQLVNVNTGFSTVFCSFKTRRLSFTLCYQNLGHKGV